MIVFFLSEKKKMKKEAKKSPFFAFFCLKFRNFVPRKMNINVVML